jgi:hypothetical protein
MKDMEELRTTNQNLCKLLYEEREAHDAAKTALANEARKRVEIELEVKALLQVNSNLATTAEMLGGLMKQHFNKIKGTSASQLEITAGPVPGEAGLSSSSFRHPVRDGSITLVPLDDNPSAEQNGITRRMDGDHRSGLNRSARIGGREGPSSSSGHNVGFGFAPPRAPIQQSSLLDTEDEELTGEAKNTILAISKTSKHSVTAAGTTFLPPAEISNANPQQFHRQAQLSPLRSSHSAPKVCSPWHHDNYLCPSDSSHHR